MSTRQKKRNSNKAEVTLDTGNEIISASRSETLLGFKIQENINFTEYLLDSKDSLIKTLNKRIGALKQIKKVASFNLSLTLQME